MHRRASGNVGAGLVVGLWWGAAFEDVGSGIADGVLLHFEVEAIPCIWVGARKFFIDVNAEAG